MARHKKNFNVQEEAKEEKPMTQEATLDNIQTEIDIARQELEKTRKEIEDKKAELVANSRRTMDAEEQEYLERQITRTNEKKAKNSELEKQKAADNVPVRGRFMNRRNPGQPVKLPYIKYEDDPVKWWPFEDGKVYTIPKGFADQINEYYHTPQFVKKEGPMDPNTPSSQIHAVDTSKKKYAFVPVDF